MYVEAHILNKEKKKLFSYSWDVTFCEGARGGRKGTKILLSEVQKDTRLKKMTRTYFFVHRTRF